MRERLTILKNIRDKCFTVMKNNLNIYKAFRNKTNFYQFFLSTDNTLKWMKVLGCKTSFKTLGYKNLSRNFINGRVLIGTARLRRYSATKLN